MRTWHSAGHRCPARPATTRCPGPDGQRAWSADGPERSPADSPRRRTTDVGRSAVVAGPAGIPLIPASAPATGEGPWGSDRSAAGGSRGRPSPLRAECAPMRATPAHDRLLDEARERFDAAEDFTVSVEEEFALLDPGSLDLVNRFEDVHAAAQGTALEPNLVGELIASEVEVKTGKQQSFHDVPGRARRATRGARRARRAARASPRRDRNPSLGALAGPAHHRHAALPAEQRAPPVRRLAQQHVRRPHARRDPRRRPRGARHLGAAQLAAGAARAVGQLAVPRGRRHGSALGPHPGLHPLLPPVRRPGRVRLVGCLRGLRSLPLRDGVGRRAHAALVERAGRTSRSRRSSSASATGSRTWARPSRSSR